MSLHCTGCHQPVGKRDIVGGPPGCPTYICPHKECGIIMDALERPLTDIKQLVADVAAAVEVLRTRDGIEAVSHELALERANNIVQLIMLELDEINNPT